MDDRQCDQGLQAQVTHLKQKLKKKEFEVEEADRKASTQCRSLLADWIVQHAKPEDVRRILQLTDFKDLVKEAQMLYDKQTRRLDVLLKRVARAEKSADSKLLAEAEAESRRLSQALEESVRMRMEDEHQYQLKISELQWRLANVGGQTQEVGRLLYEIRRKDEELTQLHAKLNALEKEKDEEIEKKDKELKEKIKELSTKSEETVRLNDRLRSLEAQLKVKEVTSTSSPVGKSLKKGSTFRDGVYAMLWSGSWSAKQRGPPNPTLTSAALVLRPRNEFSDVTTDAEPVAISIPSSDEAPASAELASVTKDAYGNATIAVLFGDGRLAVHSLTDSEILPMGTITLSGQFKSIHVIREAAVDCYALRKDGNLELYTITKGDSFVAQTSHDIEITSVTFHPEPGEDTVVVAFRDRNASNAASRIGALNLLSEDTPNTIFVEGLQCDAQRIGFNRSGTRFAAFDARRIVIYSVEENEYKLLYKMQAAIGDPLGVGILDTQADMVGVVTRQQRGFAVREGPSNGRMETRITKIEGVDLGQNLYAFSTCSSEWGLSNVWAFVAKDNEILVRNSDPKSDSFVLSHHEAPISVLTIDQSSTFVVSGDKKGHVALWYI